MYPQINKEQTPSAPPPYFESSMNQGQQPYANFNNQMLHPSAAYNDPNKTVIIQTSTIPPLGTQPVNLICPTCKSSVTSIVNDEAKAIAYIFCTFMCIMGLFCCSCLPLCMDGFKVFKHTCPKCDAYIGQHNA